MCGGNVAGVQERIAGLLSSSRNNDGTRKTQTKKKEDFQLFFKLQAKVGQAFPCILCSIFAE